MQLKRFIATATASIALGVLAPPAWPVAASPVGICDGARRPLCVCLGLTAAAYGSNPERNDYAGEVANFLAETLAIHLGRPLSDDDNPEILAALQHHIRQHSLAKENARTCFRLAVANGYRP